MLTWLPIRASEIRATTGSETMSERSINLGKIDKVFDTLAGTKEGQEVLRQLDAAFDSFGKTVGADLNADERKWVLSNLVKQQAVGKAAFEPNAKLGTRVVEGFRIHAAVPV